MDDDWADLGFIWGGAMVFVLFVALWPLIMMYAVCGAIMLMFTIFIVWSIIFKIRKWLK